jgi:S-methylmethionine-dependent homocysteine/selenocysteine methylase
MTHPPATRPLLLDGAAGTELERRGLHTHLPLWTATAARDAPGLLLAVHQDYVSAGADVLTACTFRTTHHILSISGLSSEAKWLTCEAVQIARSAASSAHRTVLVAGSIGPLEDCYAPDLTPDAATLEREHEGHATHLAEANADVLLVESMPTAREAAIATRAAARTGLPVITSLLARPGAQLYDHSSLGMALATLASLPVRLVTVNCCSLDACSDAIAVLSEYGLPFGAYPNAGDPDGSFGRTPGPLAPDALERAARRWILQGASLVGECCGTEPKHIARLCAVLHDMFPFEQGPIHLP